MNDAPRLRNNAPMGWLIFIQVMPIFIAAVFLILAVSIGAALGVL